MSPSSFGLMFMGSVVLFICNTSCVLYSTGSGVTVVYVLLSGLRMRLFVCDNAFPVCIIECLLLLCLCRYVLKLR